jgi:hypothetical protein
MWACFRLHDIFIDLQDDVSIKERRDINDDIALDAHQDVVAGSMAMQHCGAITENLIPLKVKCTVQLACIQ